MYFSVKKVVTASWQINIFPSVFSAPHLPPMFLGWLVFFFVLGIPTPLPQKNKLLFANVLKVSFLRSSKKKPVLNLSRHVTYFSAVQHPCSVSFLTFVKRLENGSCTNADLHCFTLFSWPPGPQYVHQRSSFHEKGLEAGWLSAKQKNNQMSLLISFPPSNLSVSKTLQKQSVHWVNRSVFITEILPLPHGLSQGLFGHLPNLNILACKKTSNR